MLRTHSKEEPRILIVNPYGIGDVLFSTPLISALHEKYPNAFIGYLVGSRTAQVLGTNPFINEIFVYDKDKLRALKGWKAVRYYINLIRALRQQRFNTLIDLSITSEYGAMALFLLGIKKRIGLDYKGRGRFLNMRIRISGYVDKPVARYYLDLVRFLGIDLDSLDGVADELKFYLSKEGLASAEKKMESLSLRADEKLVMVIPGGGASWGQQAWYKQWPPEYFARVADRLVEDYNARVFLIGNEADSTVLEAVAERMKVKPIICVELDLPAFSALMSFCRLVICNDGGPLHVAVSQGIPTVSFFGPVNEKVYGPYTQDKDHFVFKTEIECRPCYRDFRFPPCPIEKACLVRLDPERVLREARMLFETRLKD